MYVYRVDYKDPKIKWGPYQFLGPAMGTRLYDENHPSPAQSGIEMEKDDYSCFTSKDDLVKWFRASDINYFRKFGFDTYRFEVKTGDVKFGKGQAAFKKDKAFKREKVTIH